MEGNASKNVSQTQWEKMFPRTYRFAKQRLGVVFLPLGVIEWHGEHNVFGLDALKAHKLCVNAAEEAGGGVVHPPIYGGMGGIPKEGTLVMENDMAWSSQKLQPWLEKLCFEFHRHNFEAIIILTGHYGHSQQIIVRETACRMTEKLQIPVLGIPEYWLALDVGYIGGHAGVGESSLMQYLFPNLVSLEKVHEDPEYLYPDLSFIDEVENNLAHCQNTEKIEERSSPELGEKFANTIVDRLANIAISMPDWGQNAIASFVQAERKIVSVQLQKWREEAPWKAWEGIHNSNLDQYGKYLEEENFSGIRNFAENLAE